MRLPWTNPKEGAMVRRSLPFLATFAALVLLFVAVAPAAAYTHVNRYHLRLSRVSTLQCGTPIKIQALLTDKQGSPVVGKTINFFLFDGKPGDTLAPKNAVTNEQGKAFTFVTLKCQNHTRQVEILAEGPKGAKALITLVLHNDHERDHHTATGFLSVTTGSTGAGSGQVATIASRAVLASPVVSTSLSSMALLPVGPVLLGLMFFLKAAFRRRSTLRVPRLATA
jgi:hypothetical protein